MLQVTELVGFGVSSGGGPVVITQTAKPTSVASSGTTLTYSSQSIGTASSDRIVCLLVTTENTSASLTSATIDYGTGAQAMSSTAQGNQDIRYARIFYAPAPTGTTATFVVTLGASVSSIQNWIVVYSVTGANSTPAASGADQSDDMDATDPLTTGSVTIPTNGGFLAGAVGQDETNAKTWTNATEDVDEARDGSRLTTATSTTAGTVTITCAGTTNGEDGAMAYIIFNPG
jgi:hypothetical protein